MAFYAILNGLGRIIWGTVSDKIGRKTALFLMCLIQGVMMLAFFYVGRTEIGLIVGACIIGFNFGGNFALFPAATADFLVPSRAQCQPRPASLRRYPDRDLLEICHATIINTASPTVHRAPRRSGR